MLWASVLAMGGDLGAPVGWLYKGQIFHVKCTDHSMVCSRTLYCFGKRLPVCAVPWLCWEEGGLREGSPAVPASCFLQCWALRLQVSLRLLRPSEI